MSAETKTDLLQGKGIDLIPSTQNGERRNTES